MLALQATPPGTKQWQSWRMRSRRGGRPSTSPPDWSSSCGWTGRRRTGPWGTPTSVPCGPSGTCCPRRWVSSWRHVCGEMLRRTRVAPHMSAAGRLHRAMQRKPPQVTVFREPGHLAAPSKIRRLESSPSPECSIRQTEVPDPVPPLLHTKHPFPNPFHTEHPSPSPPPFPQSEACRPLLTQALLQGSLAPSDLVRGTPEQLQDAEHRTVRALGSESQSLAGEGAPPLPPGHGGPAGEHACATLPSVTAMDCDD